MEKANTALTAIHKVMPIERVEELMDDVAESIEYQAEIDRVLVGNAVTVDEDSLEAELEAMEREMLGKSSSSKPDIELPIAPSTPILPDAPTTVPVVATEDLEAVEKELVAS